MKGAGAGLVATLVALTFARAIPLAASDADPLAPYRGWARGPQAHMLLADARDAMLARFATPSTSEVRTAADTLAWPGPVTSLYVTLARNRTTRACVGSEGAPGGTPAEAVRALAAQALTADRRRPPVARDELDSLRVVLAFAGPCTQVADPMTIHPAREGLLIRTARGSVAFLPGEARTVAWALREARRIGVLADARDASFQRFDVVTIEEPRAVAARSQPHVASEP